MTHHQLTQWLWAGVVLLLWFNLCALIAQT
jgi:hypothetical protein